MASSVFSLALSFLILLMLGFLPLFVYAMGSFSVELIHRDSTKSPSYDANSTSYSRLKAAMERSRNRAIYFSNSIQKTIKLSSTSSNVDDNLHSEITLNDYEYLMSIYIGTPAMKILAIADTGSDLIWVQCKPCDECYPHSAPLFDPQASYTYKMISCSTDSCSGLPQRRCNSKSQCEYKYTYGDQSFVDGILSSETVSFDSTGNRRAQFPTTLFGCTHQSKGNFNVKDAGLVGLGGGKLSLIRQLGSTIESKFSYCLPSTNQTSTTSWLNFGSNAKVLGSNSVTTPLFPSSLDTFYILSLKQIIVDGHGEVDIKPTMPSMQTTSLANQGNIIIDSGTALTYIDDHALQYVVSKIASKVNLSRVTDTNGILDLCFDISGSRDSAQFPDITFRFSGGALVVLHPTNAFIEVEENIVCLAMASNKGLGVSIFGSIAQRNFHIGYDLRAMQLTMKPMNCSHL